MSGNATRLDERRFTSDVGRDVFGLAPDAARWPPDLAARFARARARFLEDAEFESSLHAQSEKPSFRDILALGPGVVPMLLADFDHDDAPWVAWALAMRRLLDDGPNIPEAIAGRRDEVVACWRQWWEARA